MNLFATLKNIFGKPEASEEDLIAEVNAAVEGNKKVEKLSQTIGDLNAKMNKLEEAVGGIKGVDQDALVAKVTESLNAKVSDEIKTFKTEALEEVNAIKAAVGTSIEKGIFVPEGGGSKGKPTFRTAQI